MDAIQVAGISAQKYQWLVLRKNLLSKLLKDYLADWKFEDNMSIYAMSPRVTYAFSENSGVVTLFLKMLL
jgi:hypothetical protein